MGYGTVRRCSRAAKDRGEEDTYGWGHGSGLTRRQMLKAGGTAAAAAGYALYVETVLAQAKIGRAHV